MHLSTIKSLILFQREDSLIFFFTTNWNPSFKERTNNLYTTDLSCEENRVVIPESLHTRLLNKIYSYDIFYFRRNRMCISCLFLTIYTINRNLIRISLSVWYFAVKRIVEEWIYHIFLIMLLLISFYKNLRRRRHSDDIFLFMFFSAAVGMITENSMHSF